MEPITLVHPEGWNLILQKRLAKGESFTLPVGVTSFGNYNEMPKPYREVSVDDYIHSSYLWTIDATDSRQILHDMDNPNSGRQEFTGVKISWSWWGGIAVTHPYTWRQATDEDSPLNERGIVYEEPVRYFFIGCKHHFVEQGGGGMHTHHTVCDHCGKKWTYDSSG